MYRLPSLRFTLFYVSARKRTLKTLTHIYRLWQPNKNQAYKMQRTIKVKKKHSQASPHLLLVYKHCF